MQAVRQTDIQTDRQTDRQTSKIFKMEKKEKSTMRGESGISERKKRERKT